MTEILTESFCERCGTRYTFESAAPRKTRLSRVRTASRGLKNYVLQDETTFSEAMADARSEEERAATAHQLDAFHKTFNFCMTCRQYTCGNCWNTAEGRCLTCSPVPGSELPPIVLAEAAPATNGAVAADRPDDTWPEADRPPVEAWPEADLSPDRLARAMGVAAAADAAEGADAEPAAAVAEAQAIDAAAGIDEAGIEAEVDEAGLVVRGIAPGQSLEDAVAAYEAQIAAEEEAELEALEVLAAEEAAGAEDEAAPVDAVSEAVDDDRPLAAAAALGAAAVVATDDDPQPAAASPTGETEAHDDHRIAATLAAGAIAAGAWPVGDDDEPEPVREVVHAEPATDAAPEPEIEPIVGPEPVSAAEAEPIAAGPEPEPIVEPELVAAVAEPEPVAAAAEPPARDDVVVQPTWPVEGVTPAAAAPEAPTPVAPAPIAPPEPPPAPAPVAPPAPATAPEPAASPWLTVAPDDGTAQPQWPAAPSWRPANGDTPLPTTLAGRVLLPRDDAAALWAASAREVLSGGPAGGPVETSAPAVAAPQPCVSCGLSLSANARFCRRCGTRQG